MNDGSAMASPIPFPKGSQWLWILGVGVVWGLITVAVEQGLRYYDSDDDKCFASSTVQSPETPPAELVEIEPGDERLMLKFDQRRGVRKDQALVTAPVTAPQQLEVSTTAFKSEDDLIPEEEINVRATRAGQSIKVDVCVDARNLDRLHPGEYSGTVSIIDNRVTKVDIPVSLTAQARYLLPMGLLVFLFPALAIYLVWTAFSASDQAKYRRGAVTTAITAVGATAAIFAAQGLNNPSWNGLTSAGALVASMYAAATAAAATFGGTGSAERDQERARVEDVRAAEKSAK
jgi:hypothetical protein